MSVVVTTTDVRNSAADALAIAASALKHENLADLTDILREIGQATGSFAVLLWELAPGVDLRDASLPDQLFPLADWISNGDRFDSHTLPLESRTGAAILENRTVLCADVPKESGLYRGASDFFEEYKIQSFVSIPLHLTSAERGALNLYRTIRDPISDHELAIAESFAAVLPGVYSAIRDKSSLKIIGVLNGLIQTYEAHPARLHLKTAKEALNKIASAISDGFRCLETSIFLVQADLDPNKARLEATTFQPYIRQLEYPIGTPGLTGWILKKRHPVRIFDLKFFERDRPHIEKRYPDLAGYEPDRLLELTREGLKQKGLEVDARHSLQPLSFMGVPILVGEDLLGVIRCCTPLRAPYYYNERDEKLLDLVASQVGHFWKNWLQLGAIENENRSWESLVTSLNEVIRGVSSQKKLDEAAILKQFLELAQDVIPGADILDIRLHDPEKNDLYFAATLGKAWENEDLKLKKRFPLNSKSAGAWVFNHKKKRLMPNVKEDKLYNNMFPQVKSMVIVPISSGKEEYGVFDVRITASTGIPPNTSTIAETLGQQLGLYLHLLRTLQKVSAVERKLSQNVARLEKAEAEREEVLRIQTRVFEDLEHQLKLPVLQAHSRLSKLLAKTLPPDKVMANMHAVRGLLRKAERVVRGMGMFVTLAKEETLRPRRSRLDKGSLIKLLIEICVDCIFLEGHKSRGLTSHVEEASFDVLDSTIVESDMELLEQAIYDVIDNACKYSYQGQQIRVSGGLNAKGKFFIAVVNKGLPLKAEDIPNVAVRGWRGPNALLATGQGSGIGCWFAQQVMLAHGGSLKHFPTTPEHLTLVRLQF